jgi:putative glutamine amidotransferase
MIIGVSASEFRQPEHIRQIPKSDPPRHDMSVSLAYLRAINGPGAIPFVIPPIMPGAVARVLATIDGLFVSGGPDIDPMLYDRAPSENDGPINAAIDAFQYGLIREADVRRMPVLTVCRGTQMLNVSRDGALHQHIPDDFPESTVSHAQHADGAFASHDVTIDKDSKLYEIMGTDHLAVNSFHHQACERLGHDLKVTARAEDGVIEAIEATDRDFMIGVQWHAESMVHAEDPQSKLFLALIRAAEAYVDKKDAEAA